MSRILVAFHTSEGQTARIAERIAEVLRQDGDDVDVSELDHAPAPDAYDGIAVGDSIHIGHHSRPMTHYLKEYAGQLDGVTSALFQVSMTSAYPDDEHSTLAHTKVQELLDHTGFVPDIVGLFAGALVYTKYGWLTRRVMRSIEGHQGGDTDTTRDYEYTDWDAVEHFAHDIHALVAAAAAESG